MNPMDITHFRKFDFSEEQIEKLFSVMQKIQFLHSTGNLKGLNRKRAKQLKKSLARWKVSQIIQKMEKFS